MPTHTDEASIILSLLEDTGVIIDCAGDGLQVTEMFKASPLKYNIVFMDIHMPEMDGYEATHCIRDFEKEKGLRAVPIIAMTANVFREDVEKCIAAGMNDHLGQPIDLNELFRKMAAYLLNSEN